MFYRLLDMKFRFPIQVFVFFISYSTYSQGSFQQNFYSLSELGPTIGNMYYLGDLNPSKQFYKPNLAVGLIYRYHVNARLAYRFNVATGSVEASDADSQNDLLVNRNLSFSSNIQEIVGGIEFHYHKYQMGNKKYRATTYMIFQAGLFHFNPTREFKGNEVELQPLGTEGQGTSFGRKRKYSRYQLCIPIGLGAKISLGKVANLNLDIAIRKTFTDYLDDVGSNYSVDPAAFDGLNDNTAMELSNTSLDNSRYSRRGNKSTDDWYVYYSASITFRLGKSNKCAEPR
jgi:hypothetical protein